MLNKTSCIRLVGTFLALCLIPALTWAAAPTVTEPSFEAPDASGGFIGSTNPTGWTFSSSTGGLLGDGTLTGYTDTQAALSYGASTTLSQAVGGMVENGGSYCLTVDVGDRSSTSLPVYSVGVVGMPGNVDCGSTVVSPVAPVSVFETTTICVGGATTGPSAVTCPGNACCGLSLQVEFTQSGGGQVAFDNVQMTPVDLQSFSVE